MMVGEVAGKDVRASRYHRAREVFDDLVGLERELQTRAVRERCATDEELLRLVMALLDADHELRATPSEDGSSVYVPDQETIGRTVGRYSIVREIGSGGMGRVYEAIQEQPRRGIALKLMRGGVLSKSGAWRFRREAELLARLDHPGIARIYEAGSIDVAGEPSLFIAMELVRNARSITDYAEERSLGIEERIELVARVCDAVQHGHQKGVIHRDIKPENVVVGENGDPRLIDFGVARLSDHEQTSTTSHTRVGEFIGTLAYMSPEQFDPDPDHVDVRADVYSLGVLLFELLSGRLPHEVNDLSIAGAALRIRSEPPAGLGLSRRSLPRGLEAVVGKALEQDREKRYSSAALLASDLRRLVRGQTIEAQPPNRWQQVAEWIGSHPVATTACACASLIAVTASTLAAGFWYVSSQPGRIVIDGARGKAQLLARDASVLEEWPRDSQEQLFGAKLTSVPSGFGARKAVLVAFAISDDEASTDGRVDAYRASKPHELLWSTKSSVLVPPPDAPDHREWPFVLVSFLVEDFLPEAPGVEILTVHRWSSFSQCAIRVFDFSGQVRYEVWHDGAVEDAAWLADPGVVLLATVEGQSQWHERVGGEVAVGYPQLVLALVPEDGAVRPEGWILRDGRVLDDSVAWCKWFGPLEELPLLGRVSTRLRPRPDTGMVVPADSVSLEVRATPSPDLIRAKMLSLTLAGDGNERRSLRVVWDDYERLRENGNLPADSVYRLMDVSSLPPLDGGKADSD